MCSENAFRLLLYTFRTMAYMLELFECKVVWSLTLVPWTFIPRSLLYVVSCVVV